MSKYNTKKSVIALAALSVLIISSLTIVILSYISFLQKHLIEDEVSYIRELLVQSTDDIQSKVIAERNVVKYAGRLIKPDNQQQTLDYLTEICSQQQFSYMGFVDINGNGYTTSGIEQNFVHEPFFTHSMHGADYMSNPFSAENNPESINILYSSPVLDDNNNAIGVVFAVSPDTLYTDILNYSVLNGNGIVYLVTKTGEILANSDKNSPELLDIMDISPDDAKNLQLIKNNVSLLNSGVNLINTKEGKYYIFFAPLVSKSSDSDNGLNSDWSLLLSIPQSAVSSKMSSIMLYTVCVCAALFLLFVSLTALNFSSQRESRKQLERLAYRDFVTNGRNYNKFKIDAEKLIAKSPNRHYAIITLDINRFKYINDLYGFDEGTRILKCIYNIVQESISNNELVGRMGNDKFVFLFMYSDKPSLQERIENLCLDISTKNSYNFVFAVGIYEITDKNLSIDSMIDRAMIALKSVKNGHQTAYAFYDEKIRNNIIRERSIENEMHDALRNEEFEIYYQPKYFINDSTLAGAEALVRWNHPERGFMPPSEFIPLFEKSEFIVKLDHYVFEGTCKNIRRWIDEGKKIVTISINFSRVHLNNPNCLDVYEKFIKKYNIPPEYLEFEFTESAIFENSSTLIKMLERIHAMGCSVSMDDFGTGYSSLNMLKEVPVDVLKLDKEFFAESSDSKRGKDIIEAIVELAKKLNIHVVAEGVEEQEQLEFLNNIKCDVAQGYYFSKPISASEFEKLLA